MKIACIYFPISSVGGISTVAKTFKRAAEASRDTFHILRSSNAKNIRPSLFAKPERIRGGDTHIEIDGEAPHGGKFSETKKFLESNYDAMFFVHPCCHPTKAYGESADWLKMYTEVNLPKAMRFSDGYAETYRWVTDAVASCNTIFVNQEAYALPLKGMGITDWVLLPQPFLAFPEVEDRAKSRLTIFPNQWKQIKCPWEFVRAMPNMKGAIELFSNGIEYYNIRGTVEWLTALGEDKFAAEFYNGPDSSGYQLSGPKNRRFHGNVPLGQMAGWYQKAWSMVDLMGQRAKHGAYKAGAYNCTTVEALYYGCRPILHTQALKSKLPADLIHCIDLGPKYQDLPALIDAVNNESPLDSKELARARDWVAGRHGAVKLYQRLKKGLK